MLFFIFLRGGKEDVLDGRGGIRHRVRHQSPQQRGQSPHATHSAQGLSQSLSLLPAFKHSATLWLVALGCGRRALGTAPTPQSCDRVGKLRRPIRDLGGCIDTGVFQRRYLVYELGFACSPLSLPHSSRVVCHWPCANWVSSQSGEEPGCMALNRAWNAALRCAPGAARSLLSEVIILAGLFTWQLKQQHQSERVICDRLPATLSAQQPFHSCLSLGLIESPGARHAMEKKKVLGGRCR